MIAKICVKNIPKINLQNMQENSPNEAGSWVDALSKLVPDPLQDPQITLYREALCRCIAHVGAGGRVSNKELRVALTHALCVSRHRVESPSGHFLTEETTNSNLTVKTQATTTNVDSLEEDSAPLELSGSASSSTKGLPNDISTATTAVNDNGCNGNSMMDDSASVDFGSSSPSASTLQGRAIRKALGSLQNVVWLGGTSDVRQTQKVNHGTIIVGPVRGHGCDFANLLLDEVFSKRKPNQEFKQNERDSDAVQEDADTNTQVRSQQRQRKFRWPKSSIVILGNLIDGGQQSVEVLTICCWLLLAMPNQVVILKGAHELLFPISNECTSQLVGRLDRELKMRFLKLAPQYKNVVPTQAAYERQVAEATMKTAQESTNGKVSTHMSAEQIPDPETVRVPSIQLGGSPVELQTSSLQSTLSAVGGGNPLGAAAEFSSSVSPTLLASGTFLAGSRNLSSRQPSWKQLYLNVGIPRSLGPSPFANLPRAGLDDDINVRNDEYYQVEREIYDLFDTFPLACVVDDLYFCTTGGIPATLTKLSDINTGINRVIEGREDSVHFEKCCELVFSDPMDEDDEARLGPMALFAANLERGLSHVFSYNAVCRFLKENDLVSVIRANSYTSHRFSRATNPSGRLWHYQYSPRDVGYRLYKASPGGSIPTVISIFSAPEFESINHNIGAFIELPRSKSKEKKKKSDIQSADDYANSTSNNIVIRQFAPAPNRPLQMPGTTANAFSWSIDLMSYYCTSAVAAMLSDLTYAPESMVVNGKEPMFYAIPKAQKRQQATVAGGGETHASVKDASTFKGARVGAVEDSDEDLQPTSIGKSRRGGRMARRMMRMAEAGTATVPMFGSSFNPLTVGATTSDVSHGAKIDERTAAEKADKMVPNLHSQYLAPLASRVPYSPESQLYLSTEALLEQYKRKLVRLCVLIAEEGIPVEQVRSAVLPSGSRATSAATSPQNVSLSVGLGVSFS